MSPSAEPFSRRLSTRLLPVLQLTRMALVFTAIADSLCELLLRARRDVGPDLSILTDRGGLDPWRLVAVGLVSVGLYGFGMSLNDIIDRRRDTQIAAHRPLPSGRIGVFTAHIVCTLLVGIALLAGGFYATQTSAQQGRFSFTLLIGTAALITFYDFAGKYLVGLGLLSLGLIRFFHCLIPAPAMPLVWHPLLLLNHVAILSTVAYSWEEKRPSLTRVHWIGVLGALAVVDAMVIGFVGWRNRVHYHTVQQALWINSGLIWPAVAVVAFVGVAAVVRYTSPTRRAAGQKLMLFGLLWLIVYDACFAAGYVGFLAAGCLLLLFPVAYFSVQMMRWWSQLLLLSHRPQYQRAGRDGPIETKTTG